MAFSAVSQPTAIENSPPDSLLSGYPLLLAGSYALSNSLIVLSGSIFIIVNSPKKGNHILEH